MSDYPADLHEWVSFDDEDGDTWQFDLTFLTSNYGCIYGKGCPGVFTELAPEYEHGCCTYGAHFVDKEDRQSIRAQIDRLEPGEWELAERAAEMGGPIFKNSDGEWVTQTVDDACIFLNRPGFEHGAGCALHQAAVRSERPLDWKPDVCWQVPIRFDEHTDDNGHTTFILREWKRRDWGRRCRVCVVVHRRPPRVQRGPPRVEDLTGGDRGACGRGPVSTPGRCHP